MNREEAWQGLEGYALFIANGTDLKEAISMAIEALKDRPTGTWEIHYNYWNGEKCRCSVCGYDVCHPTWNYCPKCGSYNDDVVEVRGEDE